MKAATYLPILLKEDFQPYPDKHPDLVWKAGERRNSYPGIGRRAIAEGKAEEIVTEEKPSIIKKIVKSVKSKDNGSN